MLSTPSIIVGTKNHQNILITAIIICIIFPMIILVMMMITLQSDWTGQRQVQCPVTQIVATQLTPHCWPLPHTRKAHKSRPTLDCRASQHYSACVAILYAILPYQSVASEG